MHGIGAARSEPQRRQAPVEAAASITAPFRPTLIATLYARSMSNKTPIGHSVENSSWVMKSTHGRRHAVCVRPDLC